LRVIDGVSAENVLMVTYAENSKFWQDEEDRDRITEVAAALGKELCMGILLHCD